MAPYNDAVKVRTVASDDAASANSGRTAAYEGIIDPTWNIGNVPCGGYVLALVLEACIQHQVSTSHVDPLHISAHFLRPTTPSAPFVVRVKTLKAGKGFTNLTADFVQQDGLRITAHAIFGVNSPSDDAQGITLKAPSPYARRVPIYSHPSEAKPMPLSNKMTNFSKNVGWAYDLETIQKNNPTHPNRATPNSVGGSGLEWAAWFEFKTPTEKLSNIYIPFLVDMFSNTISLLPREERGNIGVSWFPTMTLAVDFKFPICMLGLEHSQRTAGIYSSGRFISNPQSRHDIYVEVWSAPSNIGERPIKEGWREKQICLATATQMALTVPIEVNMNNAKRVSLGVEGPKL
ncbi:hypothetical protein FA15DRAFT_619368 [Coprinopsis marcescibilis]|uniref:Acyl-CoA thioesterase-like N-terminal HotDog domain-containing protein n=1 Tax=Coprinopsis marcescibilis TaxID=230819 RepID=A0A5C3KVK3_COPMA|nr:hypothetical protein FA15DRAFT_619368 [Coprinopsis marcescibilis]